LDEKTGKKYQLPANCPVTVIQSNSSICLIPVSCLISLLMTRLVLFDIDGTLISTGGAGVKAFARAFGTEFGVPDSTRRVKFAGRTDRSLVRELFALHDISPTPENFHRFFDTYVFWLDHLISHLNGTVLPGVHDLIAGLRRLEGPPLIGLLTGNIRLGAELKLRHYELWDHFETGAFGDDHEDRNQLAAIARDRGNELLGQSLEAEEVLVIGDTPLDIACARAIGAQALAVATGGATLQQLKEHSPTWAVADLRQVDAEQICAARTAEFAR